MRSSVRIMHNSRDCDNFHNSALSGVCVLRVRAVGRGGANGAVPSPAKSECPCRFWRCSLTHAPTLCYMNVFSDNYLGTAQPCIPIHRTVLVLIRMLVNSGKILALRPSIHRKSGGRVDVGRKLLKFSMQNLTRGRVSRGAEPLQRFFGLKTTHSGDLF